ncbi:tRNA (34-2'-O)-methyltransferase regulator WDR6 isoform X2 [Ambystoma mexicanum]|uniref:tRNA (34-2'-O)-methyltransferase regulator WDR6 isoform X2 n=1 Tax=Ambystoma mexicanum TaxID=8296 RepID=UPI0037E94331
MESVIQLSPITALEFVKDHLLAGEGSVVTVYSLTHEQKSARRHSRTVLGNHRIHGIKPCGLLPTGADGILVAVFGGKGLIVLGLRTDEDDDVWLSEVSGFWEAHDWIWDLQWLKAGMEPASLLALALGHNSVALYDYTTRQTLQEVHCAEKCILYSAHFVGSAWKELLLVAGTVFNQLVIWRMSDPLGGDGTIRPQKRIDGHQGVIFSIDYLESKGLLASASDDRSLRLWDVGDLQAPGAPVQCLLVLYGHQSRVWSVRLLHECLLSIGEDSACIVWSYAGDITHTFKGHKGRGIRAVAVHEGRGWVATGGADAGIRLWHLKGGAHIAAALTQLDLKACCMKGSPKALKLIDATCLLIMTDAGSIYTYDVLSRDWTLVLEDDNYQSYSLLDVARLSDDSVVCAIGSIMGYVKIFAMYPSVQDVGEIKVHEGKVHSLTWVSARFQGTECCSLFSSGPDGVMVQLEVSCSSGHIREVRERGRYRLPQCRQRWHTCLTFLRKQQLIICGDRRGSLLLYSNKVEKKNSCHPASNICIQDPISLLFGVHGKLGVTSLACRGDVVYSTGRDGAYRQLEIEGDQLKVLRKQKPCKGMDWIEKLVFTPECDLLVMGFQSTDFVLWSTKTNEKLHCVSCGGGHRSWSYSSTRSSEAFAYIKSSEVFVYQRAVTDSGQSVIKDSLHGREITCVRHAGSLRVNGEHIHILVTSSEDTTVNVLAFSGSSNKISHLATISDHISSVRTMVIATADGRKDDPSSCSPLLFSAGGRAEIECYRLLVSRGGEQEDIRCQVVHLASHRLDETWDRMKNKHKVLKMDSDTRYMSLAVADGGKQGLGSWHTTPCIFLAAACSDGSVRVFLMPESAPKLLLIAESFYHRRCVLRMDLILPESADGDRRVFLCSAATDGRIAFWDITATLEKSCRSLEITNGESQPAARLSSPLAPQHG